MKIFFTYSLFLFLLAYAGNAASTFKGERLEAAAKSYIESKLEGDFEVKTFGLTDDVVIDKDNIHAEIKESADLKGIISVPIIFKSGDKVEKSISVKLEVKTFELVPVASKYLKQGDEITSQDFTLKRLETSLLKKQNYNTNELIGRTMAKNVRSGDPIALSDTKGPLLIKRGDVVELSVISGAVRIRANAVSLQDASAGDRVRIKRDGESKVLQGIVARDGSVLIASPEYYKDVSSISGTK